MATNSSGAFGMSKDYNANSRPQKSAVDSTIPYVREAIDLLDTPLSSNPLIIADFGSAHGANSILAMKYIIQYLKETKKIQDEKSLLIVHNDLPANDWRILFDLLEKDKSYHAVASGRSFYEQCLPPNTLTLGFSSTSLHWLTNKPCNISDHCTANFTKNAIEHEAFKRQAKHDLATFFQHRSRELVPNGVLILNIQCTNSEGSLGFDIGLHLLYECAKAVGLTEQELLDYSIPIYYRSFEECIDTELFDQCSLKLIKAEFHKFELEVFTQFQNGHLSLDQYAKIAALVMRSWSEPILKQILETNKRSNVEIEKILTQFWIIYEQRLKDDSSQWNSCFYYTYLILKKFD